MSSFPVPDYPRLRTVKSGGSTLKIISATGRIVAESPRMPHTSFSYRSCSPKVRIKSEVRSILLEVRSKAKEEDYVFSNPKTGLNLTDVKTGFKGACKDTGLSDFKFHDLRHTAGTRLADAGADGFTIAEILGHGSLQMTKRYPTQLTTVRDELLKRSQAPENCHKQKAAAALTTAK